MIPNVKGRNVCRYPGCGRIFGTAAALGGHQGAHTKARRGITPTPPPPPKPVKVRAEPPRRTTPPAPKGIPKVTVVIAALDWPCPDCERVYDDGHKLDHHRRVIHDLDRVDLPHEVAVRAATHAEKVG